MILFLFVFVVIAWLTYWSVKICFYLLMGMIVVCVAVIQGITYALTSPSVAQWIERRQSTPEVARSTRAGRSSDTWACCGAPTSGGHRGTYPNSQMRGTGPTALYPEWGLDASGDAPTLEGGTHAT